MPRTRFDNLKGLVDAEPDTDKRKRAPAKKKDENNKAVLIFVRRDLHQQAKYLLLDEGKDFSDLVNEMLTERLKSTKSAKPIKSA